MQVFAGCPYELDMLYMKVSDNEEAVSMPLCEALAGVKNIKYDRDKTIQLSEEKGGYTICFNADTETEKQKSFEVPVNELAATLEAEIYNKQKKITKLAIQPEGELLVNEVEKLIN